MGDGATVFVALTDQVPGLEVFGYFFYIQVWKQCLEALDEPKRQSILLAYINGFTHGEVAGQLKVPLGTAKSWIKRGLSMLRECLS